MKWARGYLKSHIEYVCLIPYLLLWLLAVPAFAQVQAGGLNLSLTGDLGVGYTADYGSVQSSDHSASINGDASLTGYYYNPNFLRFSVTPNYNRSQENSGGQSITDATNVSASVGFFGVVISPVHSRMARVLTRAAPSGCPVFRDSPPMAMPPRGDSVGPNWFQAFRQ